MQVREQNRPTAGSLGSNVCELAEARSLTIFNGVQRGRVRQQRGAAHKSIKHGTLCVQAATYEAHRDFAVNYVHRTGLFAGAYGSILFGTFPSRPHS